MAYVVDQYDWLTRTWAAQLAVAINGGTFSDYVDTEKVPDPAASPEVGPDEALDIVTPEWGNLVDNFMRECHQALEGVRGFRLRTTEGGGTALTIGSIANDALVMRSGTSLVGVSLASVQTTFIERRDGVPSMNAATVEIDQTTGLSLVDAGSSTARIIASSGTTASIGTANANGSMANGIAAADHVHGPAGYVTTTAGGGTTLSVGSIADGTIVTRSGTSLVGTAVASLSGFDEAVQDHIGAIVAGNGISRTYDDGAGLTTIAGAEWVYHESDWSALSTNAFTDGSESVGGVSYTVVQSALVGSWGIVNGSGMVWVPATSQTRSWSVASPTTAPYFYVALSSLTNVDLQRPLLIDVHLTGQVYENGNDAVRIGLWEIAATPYAASTARARMMDRGNFGPGTSTVRGFDGSTATTSAEAFAPDCVSLRVEPAGNMQVFYGTWSSGWPAQWSPAVHNPTVATVFNTFSLSARITFVFISASDPSITTTATIANVRYRRG